VFELGKSVHAVRPVREKSCDGEDRVGGSIPWTNRSNLERAHTRGSQAAGSR